MFEHKSPRPQPRARCFSKLFSWDGTLDIGSWPRQNKITVMASALLRPKRHPLFLNLCLPSSSCGFWSACPASELRQLCLPQQMRPMSTRSRRPATPASVANSQIKAPQVRLIGLDGAQLGVLDTSEARRLAAESNADLILVAPNASPPVAKLGSTVALRLAAEKKEAAQRRAVRATKMKEVRLTGKALTTTPSCVRPTPPFLDSQHAWSIMICKQKCVNFASSWRQAALCASQSHFSLAHHIPHKRYHVRLFSLKQ